MLFIDAKGKVADRSSKVAFFRQCNPPLQKEFGIRVFYRDGLVKVIDGAIQIIERSFQIAPIEKGFIIFRIVLLSVYCNHLRHPVIL